MTPTFSSFLPLLSLVTLVSASSVASRNIHIPSSSTVELPKQQAEKFIRALNLFPELDANIVEYDPQLIAPTIVEKNFVFLDCTNRSHDSNGTTLENFGHHAGYYRLPHTKAARMFYFFFESRNKNSSAPVVVWLTGGPGCSSSLALFYENGPFHLKNDLSLEWNDYGWDKASNLLYIDQPTGTGFSYSSDRDDIRSSSKEAAGDFYDFLQEFFKKHPRYAKNDFYITGESYGGHYVPAFAARVHQGNKNKDGLQINLKGIAIGNGLTNPEIQYKAYPDYALDMKLINKSEHDGLNKSVSTCEALIKKCGTNSSLDCTGAFYFCNTIFDAILNYAGNNVNFYDIRMKCKGPLCYDFSRAEKFLNKRSVKKALGVGDIDFVSCSTAVYDKMIADWPKNYEVGIPALLQDEIKVLIYAGEYDLICNWLGNSRWVDAIKWSGQKEFLSTPYTPFKVDKLEAGIQKSHGPLTFLKVHNAGHMVPMDQPKASLKMLTRWMHSL